MRLVTIVSLLATVAAGDAEIAAALAPPTSPPPPCSMCHAGHECGICLRLLRQDECPMRVDGSRNGGLLACNDPALPPGVMCEADGPCGTSDQVNNCQYSFSGRSLLGGWSVHTFDVYIRLDCTLQPPSPPTQPPPPSPPPRLPPPVSPPLPHCDPTRCDAGAECGYCLRRIPQEECPQWIMDVRNGGLPPCDPGKVPYGQMCEGDGPCGTSDALDNCNYREQGFLSSTQINFDVYLREECYVAPMSPPHPPLPPAPPAPPPAPAFPDCGHCDAGAQCGYCLKLLDPHDCPRQVSGGRNGGLAPCEPGRVAPGQLCEGDSDTCGTSDVANNCGYVWPSFEQVTYDVYVRLACHLAPHTPPALPPPPSPPAPPAPPPPPALPACVASQCEAGLKCGMCLRRLTAAECPPRVKVWSGEG